MGKFTGSMVHCSSCGVSFRDNSKSTRPCPVCTGPEGRHKRRRAKVRKGLQHV